MVKSKIAITRELKKTANVNFFNADMTIVRSEIQVRYDGNKVISLSKKDVLELLKDSEGKE